MSNKLRHTLTASGSTVWLHIYDGAHLVFESGAGRWSSEDIRIAKARASRERAAIGAQGAT